MVRSYPPPSRSPGYSLAIDPKTLADPPVAYVKLDAITPIDRQSFFVSVANASSSFAGRCRSSYRILRPRPYKSSVLAASLSRRTSGDNIPAERCGASPGIRGLRRHLDGTRIGEYGLEKQYDDTLAQSSSGLYVNPFAEIFANMQDIVTTDPSANQGSIITSIEPNVQQELETTLAEIMKEYTPNFDGGIIMDPHTGAIYAMGMDPSFDPNNYGNVQDAGVYQNSLVSGRYEMGSIMKPLDHGRGDRFRRDLHLDDL